MEGFDTVKISYQRVVMTISALFLFGGVPYTRACQYSSLDPRHTMCIFQPRDCSGKRVIKSGGLSCKDKDDILMAHNVLRQKLALGAIRGQPAALNMQTLIWDDELAEVAQRWADQCRPGHDRSRNIRHFTVGQNVAAVWTYERDEGNTPDFETQINAWFNEVNQHGFAKPSIEPFKYKKSTGHYTQMAWAETYLVGCGYTYYEDPSTGHTKLYVCNYAPGGNVVGGSMYKIGYPGQQYCVGYGLRPNQRMQGLCEQEGLEYEDQCSKMNPFMRPPSQKNHHSSSNEVISHYHSSHSSAESIAHYHSSSSGEVMSHYHLMTMMTPPPPPLPPAYGLHNTPSAAHHHFTIPTRSSYPSRQGHFKKSRGPSKHISPWKLLNHFG